MHRKIRDSFLSTKARKSVKRKIIILKQLNCFLGKVKRFLNDFIPTLWHYPRLNKAPDEVIFKIQKALSVSTNDQGF